MREREREIFDYPIRKIILKILHYPYKTDNIHPSSGRAQPGGQVLGWSAEQQQLRVGHSEGITSTLAWASSENHEAFL